MKRVSPILLGILLVFALVLVLMTAARQGGPLAEVPIFRRPLIITAILFTSLVLVFLLRQASFEGKIVMAFALLAGAAYLRLHFYLLLLTSMSLFAFIGLAFFWAMISTSGFTLKRKIKKEALAGENVPVDYEITTSAWLPAFHTRIWDRSFRERGGGETEEFTFEEPGYLGFLRIGSGEPSEGILHFAPPVRGQYRFGPVAIEGGDPFGIFTLTRWLPVGDECLVLPSWVRLNAIPSIPARLGVREQEHLITREGQSHEFLGIRPWTEGDSLRGVHWPLTAKHDALIMRQFQREVEEEMIIILDAEARADVGEGAENALEYLITLALSIANSAYEAGKPWMLVIADEEMKIVGHNTKNAMKQIQYYLAMLTATRTEPIESMLDDIRARFANAACILLTPRTDPGPGAALARGDAKAGEGVHSILVRIDPESFATSVEDGARSMKARRMAREVPNVQRHGEYRVPEFTVARGDNIADLFPGRTYA
jgi:uncharacterized protein (DUF58 family)